MLEFVIDYIFVDVGGQVFQQAVKISMNCAPLLADLFLYSYEAELLHEKKEPLAVA
jgi:hypothetical protein